MNENPEERAARFRRFPQEAEWTLDTDYPDPRDVAVIRQIARDESHGGRAREWAKVLRLAEEKFNRPETLEDAPGQDLCDIQVCRKLGEPEVVVLRSDYYPANLRGAALRRANLFGLRFAYGADLRDADLREADLRYVRFGRSDLRGANLRGAQVSGADMSQCALAGADLREVVFGDEATQAGVDLQRVDFRETRIAGARFVWCNLAGADFRDMDLSSVSFIFCRTHGMRDGVSSKDGSPLPLAWRPAMRTGTDTPGMSRWAGDR